MKSNEEFFLNYLYKNMSSINFSKSCFLCGKDLGANKSVEHTIPRWLQKQYNLKNEKYILFNESGTISLNNLNVQRCLNCNNNILSKLESEFKDVLVNKKFKGNEMIVVQWLTKIYYAILYRKTFLRKDIKVRDSKPIISKDELGQYRVILLLLQSVYKTINIKSNMYSLAIFELKECNMFKILNPPLGNFMAMIIGDVGFIVRFLDNNTLNNYFIAHEKQFEDKKATLYQFLEICGHLDYYSHLDKMEKRYTIIKVNDKINISPHIVENVKLMEKFNIKELSKVVSSYLNIIGVSFQDIYFEETDSLYTELKYML